MSKLYFTCQKEISWKIFFSKYFCQGIFRFWAKTFQTFGQSFSAGLLKLYSTCQKENFWRIFEKKYFFVFFSDLEQKPYGLLEKNFRQGFQNCILCVRRTIWQIKKLMKTIVIFIRTSDFRQKIFSILLKDFRHACQNCILPVRKKILAKNFFRKVLFSFFEQFYSLTKTVSGVLAKNSRQACRNSIPCVKRNVLRKTFSGKKIRIFKFFRKLNGRIFDFNKKFPVVSSKLQATCPEKFFD